MTLEWKSAGGRDLAAHISPGCVLTIEHDASGQDEWWASVWISYKSLDLDQSFYVNLTRSKILVAQGNYPTVTYHHTADSLKRLATKLATAFLRKRRDSTETLVNAIEDGM